MRVRLAPGVQPGQAIAQIRQLSGNKAAAVGVTSREPVDQQIDYVRWTTNAEIQLAGILRRTDAQAFFNSPRHRDICSMPPGNQLTTLIYAELESIAQGLRTTIDDLEHQLKRMRAAPGMPIVVDTNVLLECQRLDSVRWPVALGDTRVMVPLRVIEEIDAKKYGDSQRLRSIARALLPWIDGLFPGGDPGPVRIREDRPDTIELLLADRPRFRPSDGDEEVLDAAHEVLRFAGDVRVMTADTGMRVRARHEGLDVLCVPREWLRVREKPAHEGRA